MSDRKELLEKLKMIRLELFRSAANLDMAIQGIERELEETSNEEEIRMFIRGQSEYRRIRAERSGWNEIYKLEEGVWQQF